MRNEKAMSYENNALSVNLAIGRPAISPHEPALTQEVGAPFQFLSLRSLYSPS